MVNEKDIQKQMKALGITRAEALALMEEDSQIDKGAKLFELDAELEEGARKARQADRKPTVYNLKREKKVNNDKRTIMDALTAAAGSVGQNVQVTNEEREFIFHYNGTKYKVVLSAPRS